MSLATMAFSLAAARVPAVEAFRLHHAVAARNVALQQSKLLRQLWQLFSRTWPMQWLRRAVAKGGAARAGLAAASLVCGWILASRAFRPKALPRHFLVHETPPKVALSVTVRAAAKPTAQPAENTAPLAATSSRDPSPVFEEEEIVDTRTALRTFSKENKDEPEPEEDNEEVVDTRTALRTFSQEAAQADDEKEQIVDARTARRTLSGRSIHSTTSGPAPTSPAFSAAFSESSFATVRGCEPPSTPELSKLSTLSPAFSPGGTWCAPSPGTAARADVARSAADAAATTGELGGKIPRQFSLRPSPGSLASRSTASLMAKNESRAKLGLSSKPLRFSALEAKTMRSSSLFQQMQKNNAAQQAADEARRAAAAEKAEWEEHWTDDGEAYYHHKSSGQTVWEPPACWEATQ